MKWLARFSSAVRQATASVAGVVDARDLFFFLGMTATCYGVSLIYPPAAWIVGGLVAVALGLLGGRRQ